LIEAEERVARLDLELLEDVRRRLVLDDDGDVLHLGAEAPGDVAQRLFDQAGEVFAGDRGHYLVSLDGLPIFRRV
jgi:hypothetical protein